MDFYSVWMWLATPLGQLRFRVEQVHLAGAAILHELDYRLGCAWEMARSRLQVTIDLGRLLDAALISHEMAI
jgi:hypothetical protein